MLPNPQSPVDLVKPTEEIRKENFLFMRCISSIIASL